MSRLSPTSYIVLGMIDWLGPSSPYRLKKALAASIAGVHPVPHTTFYAEPARLAAAGYLDESQEDGGRRQKRYALTQQGRDALAEWLETPDAEPTELRAPAIVKVFFGADPARVAAAPLARHRELLSHFEELQARDPGDTAGRAHALRTGIEYHRFWVQAWERIAGGK